MEPPPPPPPPLPYDYEVEFLESTGEQRIDTGILPSTSCDFSLDVEVVATTNTDSCLFCASTTWAFGKLGLFYTKNLEMYYLIRGAAWSINLSRHVFRVNAGDLYQDGQLKYDAEIPLSAIDTTLKLISDGTGGRKCICRIYSFKYVDQDTRMELIPVVKDGIGCFYDVISETVLYNQGSGQFIIGPKK